MHHFAYRDGVLHAEQIALPDIADAVGTPVYVYSRATLERHARVFKEALSGLDNPHIAFAIKANPNLAVLKVLAKQGYGADVVSGGEMDRALAAGIKAEDIVFSGVGKTAEEIVRALKAGIGQFNIESEEEGRELAILADTLGHQLFWDQIEPQEGKYDFSSADQNISLLRNLGLRKGPGTAELLVWLTALSPQGGVSAARLSEGSCPVLLADVEGFSYKEIAEILDIPIGTVMSRLHRGRKAMQKRLTDFATERGLLARTPAGGDDPVPDPEATIHG